MTLYSAKKYKTLMPGFSPSNKKLTKKAIKKGQDVLGKIGKSSAPKGYYQSGTTTRTNKAGTQTFAIYSKLQAPQATKPKKSKQKTQNKRPQQTRKPPKTVKPNIPEYQPQYDTKQTQQTQQKQQSTTPKASGFSRQINQLNKTINTLTSGFQSQLGTLQGQLTKEREAADTRMEEMQSQFQQALAANAQRSQIEGIRFADRGTGGATQQQLQRAGVRGTFSRAGSRLMKISGLNV